MMVVQKRKTNLALLLLIFPILALPKIFSEIYKGRYYALHYLVFFMAIISYLIAPTGDVHKYYLDYQDYKSVSFYDFMSLVEFDIVHQTILYSFARLGIYFGFVRFFICIVCYELIFSVFKKIMMNSPNRKTKDDFYKFLLLFFAIGFATFLRAIRFNLALSIFIFAYYDLYFGRKTFRGMMLMVITALTHYSMIPIIAIALFFRVFPIKMPKYIALIILVVFGLLGFTVLSSAVEALKFGLELQERLDVYTSGYWATEFLSDYSFMYMLSGILATCAIYPMIILFFMRIKYINGWETYFALLIILVIAQGTWTIYNRYAILSVILFIVIFYVKNSLFHKKDIKVLLFVSFFSYLSTIYAYHRELSVSYVDKIFYEPLPILMMNQYDQQWVNRTMYDTGDFIRNN